LQGGAEHVPSLKEGLLFTEGEDLAGGGGLGKGVHLGDEGNGGFDGQAFGIGVVVKGSGWRDGSIRGIRATRANHITNPSA
jgi:hypothetical protein